LACRLSFVLAAFIPGATTNRESLGAAYDPVECIEGRPVDNGGLMTDQHSLCIVEGVHHHSSSIAKADLKDADMILPPPRFTYRCMVIAEFEEVAGNWQSTRDFWYAFDVWDICCGGELDSLSINGAARRGKLTR